jgi:hypothetical protein
MNPKTFARFILLRQKTHVFLRLEMNNALLHAPPLRSTPEVRPLPGHSPLIHVPPFRSSRVPRLCRGVSRDGSVKMIFAITIKIYHINSLVRAIARYIRLRPSINSGLRRTLAMKGNLNAWTDIFEEHHDLRSLVRRRFGVTGRRV